MQFRDYQTQAEATAIYPDNVKCLYPALGLCGEAGEVAEKIKKLYRDKGGVPDAQFLIGLEKEVGDVLWYLAAICRDFDISLNGCALMNLEKLASRQQRGVLQGSGDTR
jgi:NTP pyrophosphatase (non-canonical NTP hydrolase)